MTISKSLQLASMARWDYAAADYDLVLGGRAYPPWAGSLQRRSSGVSARRDSMRLPGTAGLSCMPGTEKGADHAPQHTGTRTELAGGHAVRRRAHHDHA